MVFENTANGYRETPSIPWLWTLLFGSFYFAFKGIWSHAFISFVLACVTVGLSWFIYPFFARGIVRTHYLKRGWKEIPEGA